MPQALWFLAIVGNRGLTRIQIKTVAAWFEADSKGCAVAQGRAAALQLQLEGHSSSHSMVLLGVKEAVVWFPIQDPPVSATVGQNERPESGRPAGPDYCECRAGSRHGTRHQRRAAPAGSPGKDSH